MPTVLLDLPDTVLADILNLAYIDNKLLDESRIGKIEQFQGINRRFALLVAEACLRDVKLFLGCDTIWKATPILDWLSKGWSHLIKRLNITIALYDVPTLEVQGWLATLQALEVSPGLKVHCGLDNAGYDYDGGYSRTVREIDLQPKTWLEYLPAPSKQLTSLTITGDTYSTGIALDQIFAMFEELQDLRLFNQVAHFTGPIQHSKLYRLCLIAGEPVRMGSDEIWQMPNLKIALVGGECANVLNQLPTTIETLGLCAFLVWTSDMPQRWARFDNLQELHCEFAHEGSTQPNQRLVNLPATLKRLHIGSAIPARLRRDLAGPEWLPQLTDLNLRGICEQDFEGIEQLCQTRGVSLHRKRWHYWRDWGANLLDQDELSDAEESD